MPRALPRIASIAAAALVATLLASAPASAAEPAAASPAVAVSSGADQGAEAGAAEETTPDDQQDAADQQDAEAPGSGPGTDETDPGTDETDPGTDDGTVSDDVPDESSPEVPEDDGTGDGEPGDEEEPSSSVPAITGTLAVGRTIVADPGAWTSGASFSYQWFSGTARLGSATSSPERVLTSAEAGKQISVAVTGTSPSGDVIATETSPVSARVATAAVPTVAGAAVVGRTITASQGTWTAKTSFSHQWYADGVAIPGATKASLAIAAAQAGKRLTVVVTGRLSGYATVAVESKATAQVALSAVPAISGAAGTGLTLTAKPGTWTSGTTFSYQWYANGKAVSGATKSTLTVTTGTVGKRITVKVTGRKSGHTTVSTTSKATAKVATVGSPSVSGSAAVGSKLTAATGTWTSGTAFSYRWYANGTAIPGATKSTYTVGTGQKGMTITVAVTGRKSGYATATKTSRATAKVATVATPGISGSPKVASTLTAKPGTWTSGTTFSYQWYANGKAVSGATKSTLTVTTGMVGKRITVKVTGRKSGYGTASKTSKQTSAVSYPTRTSPSSTWSCPAWAPIKGNADSGIYHLPSGAYYSRTKPEECFRTEAAARAAGYRASKR